MCTILVRYAQFAGITLIKDKDLVSFDDDSTISEYAKEAVYACQQACIIDGMGDGSFQPKGKATRAQVAKILSVFHQIYISK